MLILDRNPGAGQLQTVFREIDGGLAGLERQIAAAQTLPLAATVDRAIDLLKKLVIAYVADEGKKEIPDAGADLLDIFKVLVKGEPSWTAIRDNCRELVYYRNCINMGRQDALPKAPEKMAVRTARHVYLYIKTRCIREGRLED
ncbi:MAG TPA: hypothetical protein VLT92_12330 [Burkholderiales bacterium]|nr:hypothetical protein [Burkholderiales bacterium]